MTEDQKEYITKAFDLIKAEIDYIYKGLLIKNDFKCNELARSIGTIQGLCEVGKLWVR